MRQIQEFCVNVRPHCKTRVFVLKIHLSLQKSTKIYVQLHQRTKMSWKRSDLPFKMFQLVIRANQKLHLATAWGVAFWALYEGWHPGIPAGKVWKGQDFHVRKVRTKKIGQWFSQDRTLRVAPDRHMFIFNTMISAYFLVRKSSLILMGLCLPS